MVTEKLIAVASGKGGVGKSFFSSSLSWMLAQNDKRVLLADLDFGSANAHTYLGVDTPKYTLSDFLNNNIPNIQQVISPTPYPGLSLISGANDDLDIQNVSEHLIQNLLTQLQALPFDYIVLDLGAGAHNVFVDIFNRSDISILVSTPEKISIENAIRFAKTAFFRRFHLAEKKGLGLGAALRGFRKSEIKESVGTYLDVLNLVSSKSVYMKKKIDQELSEMNIRVVLNMVRTSSEVAKGQVLAEQCRTLFGIPVEMLGFIDQEMQCRDAIEMQKPVVCDEFESLVREQFTGIIERLCFPEGKSGLKEQEAAFCKTG